MLMLLIGPTYELLAKATPVTGFQCEHKFVHFYKYYCGKYGDNSVPIIYVIIKDIVCELQKGYSI